MFERNIFANNRDEVAVTVVRYIEPIGGTPTPTPTPAPTPDPVSTPTPTPTVDT